MLGKVCSQLGLTLSYSPGFLDRSIWKESRSCSISCSRRVVHAHAIDNLMQAWMSGWGLPITATSEWFRNISNLLRACKTAHKLSYLERYFYSPLNFMERVWFRTLTTSGSAIYGFLPCWDVEICSSLLLVQGIKPGQSPTQLSIVWLCLFVWEFAS